jgi:hypothetical protein
VNLGEADKVFFINFERLFTGCVCPCSCFGLFYRISGHLPRKKFRKNRPVCEAKKCPDGEALAAVKKEASLAPIGSEVPGMSFHPGENN